jgi:hypothetical protein
MLSMGEIYISRADFSKLNVKYTKLRKTSDAELKRRQPVPTKTYKSIKLERNFVKMAWIYKICVLKYNGWVLTEFPNVTLNRNTRAVLLMTMYCWKPEYKYVQMDLHTGTLE